MTKSRGIRKIIPIMAGLRFGKLTVKERAENRFGQRTRWLCICDCGTEKVILSELLRNGNAVSCAYRRIYSVQERFDRYTIPEPNSGCLLWFGTADKRGYGQLMDADQKLQLATHIALALAGNPIAKGAYACHRCDNPACVNVDHLYIGTPKDNTADMLRRGRNKNQFGGSNASL